MRKEGAKKFAGQFAVGQSDSTICLPQRRRQRSNRQYPVSTWYVMKRKHIKTKLEAPPAAETRVSQDAFKIVTYTYGNQDLVLAPAQQGKWYSLTQPRLLTTSRPDHCSTVAVLLLTMPGNRCHMQLPCGVDTTVSSSLCDGMTVSLLFA